MIHYGFNFTWMFDWKDGRKPEVYEERALDFLAETGFNFVRIPMDYRFWTQNFEYLKPDEKVFSYIDDYLKACMERGLHVCLNFHRVPGYCINANEIERDNLWLDSVAQEGFIFQWKWFAQRYKGVDSKYLSFDLVNEPPKVGMFGLTRENHAMLIRRTVKEIHSIDPDRKIVIDGLGGGHLAVPELSDLDVIQSGRGYQPMSVSHYKAPWWDGHVGLSKPVYPDCVWDNLVWNKEMLREFYKPWRDLGTKGVKVHIGEFGCYNKTPNNVALQWLGDLLSIYKEVEWGYSLWNFEGDFGIISHGRPDTVYEMYKGYQVDRKLLDLLMENRVALSQ